MTPEDLTTDLWLGSKRGHESRNGGFRVGPLYVGPSDVEVVEEGHGTSQVGSSIRSIQSSSVLGARCSVDSAQVSGNDTATKRTDHSGALTSDPVHRYVCAFL
jgi:hypothetical protein